MGVDKKEVCDSRTVSHTADLRVHIVQSGGMGYIVNR